MPQATENMIKEAHKRLPYQVSFDFIKCNNCGFVGLIEHQCDDCPSCESEGMGCLAWADENNPEYTV